MTDLTAAATKSSLGAFIQFRRREAGLTQKQLAEAVFVTESAVSKWERGLSYPDIATVSVLARTLGVSESELINASEDHEVRSAVRQMRTVRAWRVRIFWAVTLLLSAGVVASFIANLSVQHTLSWFWIEAAASVVLASVTLLPLSKWRGSGWSLLGALTGSLILLLAVIRLVVGGSFLTIATSSILFVALAIAMPRLFTHGQRHRAVLLTACYSALLLGYLLVVFLRIGKPELLLLIFGPIAALVLAPVWLGVAVCVYLPAAKLTRAGVVVIISGIAVWISAPILESLLSWSPFSFYPVDLSRWIAPYLPGNVAFVVSVALILAGLVLSAASPLARAVHARRTPQADK